MNKKSDRPSDSGDNRSGIPAPNVPGAARRRLLRALGRSGGLALGALLTARWHKPVVEAVALPAHAGTSPPEALGCPIAMGLNFDPSGLVGTAVGSYSLSLFVDDTILRSTATSGIEAVTLGGAATFPAGFYNPGVSIDFLQDVTLQGFDLTLSVSCCDATDEIATAGAGDSTFITEFTVLDDGECVLGD